MVASRPKLPKIGRSAAMVPVENQQSQGFTRDHGTKGGKNGVPLAHHLNSVQTTRISRTWAMECHVLLSCPPKIRPFSPKRPISNFAMNALIPCMDIAMGKKPQQALNGDYSRMMPAGFLPMERSFL